MGEALLRVYRHAQFSSRALAQKLVGTMKVPIDAVLLNTHTKHVAILVGQTFRFVSYNFGLHILYLQRQYITEAGPEGTAPGKLYPGV